MERAEHFISGERIAERIQHLAGIGGLQNGGMNRLPYSAEDRTARDLFATWLRNLGMGVRMDGVGNVIGRREGTEKNSPVVMSGSHLDTQPTGGRFDGIAGVVAAVEVIEAIQASHFVHRHPLEILDFAAEESIVRFDLPRIGSSAMIGVLGPRDLETRCRLTGATLQEVMASVGIDTSLFSSTERPAGSIKGVIELHIEQGPYLERSGKQIGIVTAVAGSANITCLLHGQQAHSGGMPMDGRRDALCGAAELLLAAESAARAQSDPPVVATVGYLVHEPQAAAIVPGLVKMVINVRSVDVSTRSSVVASIEASARDISRRRGLRLEWGPVQSQIPVKFAPRIIELIIEACEHLGFSHQLMASGGGHDAMSMGYRFPAGMIFVPSIGGVSHAPEEFTRNEDLVAGTKVLCHVLCKLAQ
jgi:hydantoinase/carbamoylase family amidase